MVTHGSNKDFKKKCLEGIMVRFVAWKRISINFQINFEQELFTR